MPEPSSTRQPAPPVAPASAGQPLPWILTLEVSRKQFSRKREGLPKSVFRPPPETSSYRTRDRLCGSFTCKYKNDSTKFHASAATLGWYVARASQKNP